jgi:hypothetical protein
MRWLVLLLLPSVASAAPFEIKTFDGTIELAREVVAAGSTGPHAISRTIYLNRHGGMLRPGASDSRTDTSSLVAAPTELPGWDIDDATWAATVACMHEIWEPFDVALTETDPGGTPHIEARFGGTPAAIGMPPKIGGVAPMAIDCGIVENAIVFTFPVNLHEDPRTVCEVMAQEIGHAYGLDHELEAADPMTYLSYPGERTFQDTTAACGETTARPCGIGGHTCRADQNSVRILRERLGEPPTALPPSDAPIDPGGTDRDDLDPGSTGEPETPFAIGCSTGGGTGLPFALALAIIVRRRSRTGRR